MTRPVRPVDEDFFFDRAVETLDRDELAGLQLERLKATLACAYERVPHYTKGFDAAGVKPADLESLTDIARFPFTVKTDLRDNYPFSMFAVPRDELALHPKVARARRQR